MNIATMIFGNATIEVLSRRDERCGEFVEDSVSGLPWRRFRIYSIYQSGGGYGYSIRSEDGGGQEWSSAPNVRAFTLITADKD